MSLLEKLERVTDRDTFLEFVKALVEDWEADEAETIRKKKLNIYNPRGDNSEWQNGTIGQFLESAAAWAVDSNSERMSETPTWRLFAEFLYCGKIYE
ncbi:MAG: hypothetical protein GYA20_11740 [Chloroflexi bacterium]|nr:hypothetical protein [Chloroflexota bacterium]